ncbi:hypothetical protein ACFX2C_005289 [Malus domestica]
MESSFQPRLLLNLIRSIQHWRRSLMVNDGRYESEELEAAFSGMVSMDKILLNLLTCLISEEVKKRNGSLKVGVSGDLSSEDDLETLSAIISALEPSSSTAAPALAHMESSSFQPRRILNSICSIQQCRRRLMAEKDDGRFESKQLKPAFSAMISAFSDMVVVEKALLNVLRRLISDEVKRRGSLKVAVNGYINSEEDLEMMSAIISALEHQQQQQEGTSSSSAAAAAAPPTPAPVAPITNWISQRADYKLDFTKKDADSQQWHACLGQNIGGCGLQSSFTGH